MYLPIWRKTPNLQKICVTNSLLIQVPRTSDQLIVMQQA